MVEKDSILVVDDDEGVLVVLEAELREYYDVITVGSAEQALAELQVREYAAIVSDVRMPGVDGLSLISQCAVRYPNMVRIILTAYDDEEVHDTAVGPHGAYKLIKPWGNDLLITLRNALKQRKLNLALKEHLDLKSEMLDIDRRLHPDLDSDTLVYEAAMEMCRLPEVIGAAIFRDGGSGRATLVKAVLTPADGIVPELKKIRATPIPYNDEHLHFVPIGDRNSPFAVITLRLTEVGGDTLRYLDFVARQAARTLLLIKCGVRTSIIPDDRGGRPEVPITWLIKELTTPTTVLSSAPYSMTKIMAAANEAKADCDSEDFEATVNEMEELFGDITMVAGSLSKLLNQLRSQHTLTDSDEPFPNEPDVLLREQ